MKLSWKKDCLNCGHHEEGETEYLGLSWWYCTKCGARHIKGELTVDET